MVLADLGLNPIPIAYWLYNTWNLIFLDLGIIINKIGVIIELFL